MAEVARIAPTHDILRAQDVSKRLRECVGTALVGKDDIVERAVIAVLARGHLLIEDIPGVGKTTLARALARAIGANYRRIQCTSDLMPSDVLGVNVYDSADRTFVFKPGPIFTNVVLADEINRATPRTQSAMLEAMSERQVTVDGSTHRLDEPFIVIATQNPDDNAGTYPLPDSQLDRFLLRTRVGYPSEEVEKQMLLSRQEDTVEDLEPAVTAEAFVRAQQQIDHVRVDASVLDYAYAIVQATRMQEGIVTGVSPRGGKSFVRAACARALVHGRTFVIPDDFSELAVPALAHRIRLSGTDAGVSAMLGESARDDAERVIRDVVARIDIPL